MRTFSIVEAGSRALDVMIEHERMRQARLLVLAHLRLALN